MVCWAEPLISAPFSPYRIAKPANLLSPYFLSAPKVKPVVFICFGFSTIVSSYLPIEISPWLQYDHLDFLLLLRELLLSDALFIYFDVWNFLAKEANRGLWELILILKLFKFSLFLFLLTHSNRLKITEVLWFIFSFAYWTWEPSSETGSEVHS